MSNTATIDLKEGSERVARPIHAYLLLLCGCMSVLAAVVIAPILPKMQAHFAAVDGVEYLVPLVLTSPGLMIAILALFVGVFADKVGRKRLLFWALVLYAAFGVAPLWIESIHSILATRIGVGFSEAVIMTCCTALIGDYYQGRQRDHYLALNTTFASTSAVIFIAIGGALGEFGWRVPFGVYAISLLLAPAVLFMLWEPKHKSAASEQGNASAISPSSWTPMRQIGICIIALIGGIAFMAVQVHIGYLLEGVGVTSSGKIGLLASGAQVAVVAGSLFFRILINSAIGTLMRLGIAFFIVGVGYLIVGLASSFYGVTVGALITGFGCGILLPTLLCWNMAGLPQERRALGAGAWMAAFFLGQFLTPIVVVGLSEQLGGFAEAFKLLSGIVLPCAAVLLLVARVLKGRASADITT